MCLSSPLAVIGRVLFDAQGDAPDGGCLPFLLLLVAFIAIWIWLDRRDEKQRAARFQEIAEQSARRFVSRDDGSLIRRLERLPTFSLVRARQITNVLYDRFADGGELALFDYRHTVGVGIGTPWRAWSVLYVRSPGLRLPRFEVWPNMLLGGARGINFETHPRFSRMYLLRSKDTAAIRALFGEELLAFLEHKPGTCVQGNGEQLVLYWRERIKPEEVEQFIQEGLEIVALLRGA